MKAIQHWICTPFPVKSFHLSNHMWKPWTFLRVLYFQFLKWKINRFSVCLFEPHIDIDRIGLHYLPWELTLSECRVTECKFVLQDWYIMRVIKWITICYSGKSSATPKYLLSNLKLQMVCWQYLKQTRNRIVRYLHFPSPMCKPSRLYWVAYFDPFWSRILNTKQVGTWRTRLIINEPEGLAG